MFKSTDLEKLTLVCQADESPGFLLWHVSANWRNAMQAALKGVDLTHPQFIVLAMLNWLTQQGGRINQVELSKATGCDVNTLSQIIRALAAKNLITRTRSHDER